MSPTARHSIRMQDAETSSNDSEAIAGAVRAAMARRRISQVALREALRWSVSYLGRRLAGEVGMSLADLVAIAGVLRFDPADLVSAAADDLVGRITGDESLAEIVAIARVLSCDPAELVAAAVADLKQAVAA